MAYHYYTIKELKTIQSQIEAAVIQPKTPAEKAALKAAEVLAYELLRDIDSLQRLCDRYTDNLARVKGTLQNCGFPGNSCGVIQGIDNIEILNGQIEALQKLAFYVFGAAGVNTLR